MGLLSACAFRRLQRIQLRRLLRGGLCDVGGHIAAPGSPFHGGLREHEAICAGGERFGFLAAIAFFDNGMAAAAVELAAVLTHEETIDTLLYRCANHGYHILSSR